MLTQNNSKFGNNISLKLEGFRKSGKQQSCRETREEKD